MALPVCSAGAQGRLTLVNMAKRTDRPKKKAVPKKGRAWLRRKVAELKTELEKLPAGRQGQLLRELEEEKEQ